MAVITAPVWENYPSTATPRNASNFNKITTDLNNINGENINGWINPNETWTYVSVDDPTGVFKVNADVTTKYSLGMRIKMTNATNKIYGIITAISYSSPNTTITFLHEINTSTGNTALHLLQDSTITDVYYSNAKCPYGFPAGKSSWTLKLSSSSDYEQVLPAQNTWYNKITFPIKTGKWDVDYSIAGGGYKSSATSFSFFVTLSNSSSSASDNELSNWINIEGASSTIALRQTVYKSKQLDITSSQNLYLNIKTDVASASGIYIYGSYVPSVIRAVCAYL